jgi:hypothetical protein
MLRVRQLHEGGAGVQRRHFPPSAPATPRRSPRPTTATRLDGLIRARRDSLYGVLNASTSSSTTRSTIRRSTSLFSSEQA